MINMAEIKLLQNEIDAATAVLASGALRQGKQSQAFEEEFAAKVGAGYAITCANGSAALHLAYMDVLKPGDEVLVPSFTFIATGSMVTLSGGKPVFCDVDPETFLIDLADAEAKVSSRTRGIAPVHLFGNACDIDAVKSFARTHNLRIVWDAAQAHGATYKGEDIGSYGNYVCYSFYPSKNMFVGEGGMVCTDDSDASERLRFMRTHGQTGKYYHTMLGFNYRMTDVEAAIGREQLKRLDDMLKMRRKNAAYLNEALSRIPGITPQRVLEGSEHAWHQYCVVIDSKEFGRDRDDVADCLKDKGIATGVHYPRGLHQQPVFEDFCKEMTLENTEFLAENILALPVHHGLGDEDPERIVEAIKACR